ncbi:AMP-binding protein [Rhodococcus sp. USK13]|uniref:AMP-binding protein n=1 Tax=Rhodococcus sp. USK13 TaxID=2806442 RepID=UPI001BCD796B|nr:AMP-binding protein [Rhodococcus sp. USK13]
MERFRTVAERYPDNDAVVGLDETMTYQQLDSRSDQVAAWLISAGLPIGGAVIVQAGNSAETVLAFYSLLKAGAVPVAALPAHRSHEIGEISRAIQAVGHLVDSATSNGALLDLAHKNAQKQRSISHFLTVGSAPDGFVRLSDVGSDIDPVDARHQVELVQATIHHEDVAVFQLSGGTTGTPKIIPRLHAEYWNQALFNSRTLGRQPHSRTAHVMPILHNAGVINALFGAHSVGGCVIPLPFADADTTIEALLDTRATDLMMISAMETWLDHPLWRILCATSLQFLIYSGSKPPADVVEKIASSGIWIGQTWGMAEGPYATSRLDAPREIRASSVGTPTFAQDDQILVVDPVTLAAVPDGKPGMLIYRGPSTVAGYYDSPEHNAMNFTPDGFLLTGDLARLIDCEGTLYIVLEGRIKDVISRGGETFSTEEVEKLLRQHTAIAEAAVVAMKDTRLGERACAYLTLRDGAIPPTLTDIQQHFAALGVAKFKWPERIEIIEELPRTATLKINKLELRSDIANRLAAEGSPHSLDSSTVTAFGKR